MKPAPFHYHRASSVAEVLDVLATAPEAKVLAGGQSLLTLMNLRLARPETVVDIGRLGELRRVFADDGRLLVGALASHRDVGEDPVIGQRHPVLPEMVSHIGHVGIRNRGTLGGSLAHADPAGEMPAAMMLLDATIHVESRDRGRRTIPAQEFFLAHFVSALEPDELVTWIEIPDAAAGSGWGFVEYAPRHGDYAVAGAAVSITLDERGRPAGLRGVMMSVAEHPVLVDQPDRELPPDPDPIAWRAWAEPLAEGLEPTADDAEYVRDLAVQAVADAAVQALGRAVEQERR